jgi:hypothetical protein
VRSGENGLAISAKLEHGDGLVVALDDAQRLVRIVDVQVVDEATQRDGE